MSSFSTGSPPLSSLGSNEPIYNKNNYNSNDSNDKNSNGIIKDKSSSKGSDAGRRVIQWDEAVIEEHNKLRGTRQRIEEAPTPFTYLSESDTESGSERGSFDVTHEVGAPLWESSQLHAKLSYEKYLQGEDNAINGDNSSSSSNSIDNSLNNSLSNSCIVEGKASPPILKQTLTHYNASPPHRGAHARIVLSPEEASGASDLSRSEELMPAEKIKEKIDFMNKRAAHYNEFKVLKALRGDDADEDDVAGAQINQECESVGGAVMDDEAVEKVKNQREFMSKRAAHYNEFNVIKALRNRRFDDEEEEEEQEAGK